MDSNTTHKIKLAGLDVSAVEEQIAYFVNGFPFLAIEKPATLDDGIIRLSEVELEEINAYYDTQSAHLDIVKFVPASGAASRMFKSLFEYLAVDEIAGAKSAFIKKFIQGLQHFGFADALDYKLKEQGDSLTAATDKRAYHKVVDSLLSEQGLNYGKLPKGLLLFHKYENNEVRTPVAEHFAEGQSYATGKGGIIKLHFTVSPEHLAPFEAHVSEVKEALRSSNFEVSFSMQKKATDTIAVTMDNLPFENEDGSLLFRPAGHGALLENLNDIDADLLFVKNIDNVVPDRLKAETITYKKAIAGLLLSIQHKVFAHLERMDQALSEAELAEIEKFAKEKLHIRFPSSYVDYSFDEQVGYLKNKLNRPIRVCGMVPNTGEPGGGPFWVKEGDGSASLQIAETSQLDMDDNHSVEALNRASHFNPVDLVCGVKNYQGEKFDLMKFRDPKTGFITQKSKNGRDLKALELPGLWNGAMADWITLFMEVPLITFNPVKTVNDLLRDEHQ
jgi:hypothetical protein